MKVIMDLNGELAIARALVYDNSFTTTAGTYVTAVINSSILRPIAYSLEFQHTASVIAASYLDNFIDLGDL